MFKVKVIEGFSLKDYETIKDIEKNGEKYPVEITDKGAKFLVDMTFKCNKEMLEYLMGGNKLNKSFVEVVEEEQEKTIEENTEAVETESEVEKTEKKKSKKGRKKNGK